MSDPVTYKEVRIPLTIYDIFGYFVPAITALVCVLAFETWGEAVLGEHFRSLLLPLWIHVAPYLKELSLAGGILVLAVVLCTVYATGHVIASLSSLFIDRLLIFRGHGYPYESLLGIKTEWQRHMVVGRKGLLGAFYSFAILTFVVYVKYFFDVYTALSTWLNNYLHVPFMKYISPFWITVFAWITIGICLVYFVSCIVICLLEFRAYRKREYDSTKRERYEEWIQWALRPILELPRVVSKLIHRRNQFNTTFQGKYREAFLNTFGMKADEAETNNYWFCEMFIQETSAAMYRRLSNWLLLYSFARNLSAALYLAFLYGPLVLIRNNDLLLKYSGNWPGDLAILKALPLAFYLLSIIMLLRYYYLYACYYTKFLFRAFVYVTLPGPTTQEEIVVTGRPESPKDKPALKSRKR